MAGEGDKEDREEAEETAAEETKAEVEDAKRSVGHFSEAGVDLVKVVGSHMI